MPDSSILTTYFLVFIGPFIQEDAAVIGAASLATNGMGTPAVLFMTILTALFLSDVWKYWIGWAALRNAKARSFVDRKHVAGFKQKVSNNLIATLFTARFLPLARIPTYVACGLFSVNYIKFCIIIFVTAFLYVSAVFLLCHFLGEVLGEQFRWVVPIIALCGLLIYMLVLKWRQKNVKPAHSDIPPS